MLPVSIPVLSSMVLECFVISSCHFLHLGFPSSSLMISACKEILLLLNQFPMPNQRAALFFGCGILGMYQIVI